MRKYWIIISWFKWPSIYIKIDISDSQFCALSTSVWVTIKTNFCLKIFWIWIDNFLNYASHFYRRSYNWNLSILSFKIRISHLSLTKQKFKSHQSWSKHIFNKGENEHLFFKCQCNICINMHIFLDKGNSKNYEILKRF